MIILVMKNPSAPTETTIVMVANANELITAMVLWKLKFLRIANQPFSHKWLKSVRKISPILIRRLFSMHAKGVATRQISETIEDIYGFETSEGFIFDVTDKIFPQIED